MYKYNNILGKKTKDVMNLGSCLAHGTNKKRRVEGGLSIHRVNKQAEHSAKVTFERFSSSVEAPGSSDRRRVRSTRSSRFICLSANCLCTKINHELQKNKSPVWKWVLLGCVVSMGD